MTGSGHVKYQENPLAGKLHGNSAWKIYLFYFLYSQLYIWMSGGHVLIMWKLSCIINDDHIFLSFGKDLPGQSSCHLYKAFQLLQNQASGHIKVNKGTGHVLYMATPSHTNESAWGTRSTIKLLFHTIENHLLHFAFILVSTCICMAIMKCNTCNTCNIARNLMYVGESISWERHKKHISLHGSQE